MRARAWCRYAAAIGAATSLATAACGRLGFDPDSSGLVIEGVDPTFVMPPGGLIDVYIEGDLEGAEITIDGAPCTLSSTFNGTAVGCMAPPHVPAVVSIGATNAAGKIAEQPDGLVYLTPGFYQTGGALDDRTSGIAIDASGAVYVSGATDGALDGANAGDFDAVLIKYDPAGRVAWIRQLGSPLWDYARDVAVDPTSGDAVIVGYGPGDIDNDGGTAGGNDIFLARYAGDGTLRWVRQFGTSGDDQSWDLAIDGSGATVLSAWTDASFPGEINAGGLDYAILRVSPTGVLEWVKQAGTAVADNGHSVAVDPSGVAYLVGYTAGVLEQGGINAGLLDLFVARYELDGTRSWIRQRGTPADDLAYDATLDPQGRPLVVGYTDGALDGNTSAGSSDIFLARFSSAGDWELTRQRGSAGTEMTWGVVADDSGQIFVSCVTSGSFDGQSNAGGNDLCLVAWKDDGTHLFTRLAGSPASDSPSSIALDAERTGLIYISLITDGALDGSPNRGMGDAAVAKYDTSGTLW